ncbi:MAG: hypothetical protein ABFC80_09300 [Coriobacteriales bacterium]|nr:hypothetical protein [Actinomycetes bacterium]
MGRAVRVVLTIVMDVLVACAVCLTLGVVVRFFAALAGTGLGERYVSLVSHLRIPFGFDLIRTPYGGWFDVDAALTVAVLLVAEWALSVTRRRG